MSAEKKARGEQDSSWPDIFIIVAIVDAGNALRKSLKAFQLTWAPTWLSS